MVYLLRLAASKKIGDLSHRTVDEHSLLSVLSERKNACYIYGVLPHLDQHHLCTDLKLVMWDRSERYQGELDSLPSTSWFLVPARICPTAP